MSKIYSNSRTPVNAPDELQACEAASQKQNSKSFDDANTNREDNLLSDNEISKYMDHTDPATDPIWIWFKQLLDAESSPPTYQILGEMIRNQRKRLCITRAELAHTTGVNRSLLTLLENGYYDPQQVTFNQLDNIAIELGLEESKVRILAQLPDTQVDSSEIRRLYGS